MSLVLVLVGLWGMGSVFVVPPFQVADEERHFYRAWSLSELQFTCSDQLSVSLPSVIVRVGESTSVSQHEDTLFSWRRIQRLNEPIVPEDRSTTYTQYCVYNPVGYAPQVVGLWIARIIDAPVITSLWIVRIVNLLVALGLTCWAIRVTPVGKWLFAVVASFPMLVYQYASASSDALTFAGLLLVVACILRATQQTTSFKQWLGILALTTVFIPLKSFYLPVVLLLLLIRPAQVRCSRAQYWWVMGATLLLHGALFFIVLRAFPTAEYIAYVQTELHLTDIQPVIQRENILTQPTHFLQSVLHDMNVRAGYYYTGLIGNLGWLTLPVPGLIVVLITGLLAITVSTEQPWQPRHWSKTVLCILTVFCSVLLIFGVAYVYWTAPESALIAGVQGRYFIPLVVVLLIPLLGFRPSHAQLITGAAVSIILISIATVASITEHFYTPYLASTPDAPVVATTLTPYIVGMSGIEQQTAQTFATLNNDPQLIIDTRLLQGFSAHVQSVGPIQLFYLFEGDTAFSEKQSDVLTRERTITLDIGLLEKEQEKELVQLRIDPTNTHEGTVIISDVRVY